MVAGLTGVVWGSVERAVECGAEYSWNQQTTQSYPLPICLPGERERDVKKHMFMWYILGVQDFV